MLILFLSLWSSSHMFYHTHIVDNQTVTHSHPYSKSEHTHSSAEFQLITMNSLHLALLAVVCLLLNLIKFARQQQFFIKSDNVVSLFKGALLSLRAPPVSC